MPTDIDVPTHINIRIDPKIRFLTELACQARQVSLTEYIEEVLQESFRRVFLHEQESVIESLQERRERLTPPAESIASYADALWSESPIVRLQLRATAGLDNAMSEYERGLWAYISERKDLRRTSERVHRKGEYELDRQKIESQWSQIKADFLVAQKGKTK